MSIGVPARRGRGPTSASMLFLSVVPGQNLIENDGAECCGAYSSHCESAELEGKVAGTGRKRRSDGDQISWVGEVYPILYPDPAGHGGYQTKQHDQQATGAAITRVPIKP